jgi:hypothetical protein
MAGNQQQEKTSKIELCFLTKKKKKYKLHFSAFSMNKRFANAKNFMSYSREY